jgi:hypothetical protein
MPYYFSNTTFSPPTLLTLPQLHLLSPNSIYSFFQPESSQEELFNNLSDLVTSCIDGYNVTGMLLELQLCL